MNLLFAVFALALVGSGVLGAIDQAPAVLAAVGLVSLGVAWRRPRS